MVTFKFEGKDSETTNRVVNDIYNELAGTRQYRDILRVYLGRKEIKSLLSLNQPDRDRLGVIGDSLFYGVKKIFITVEIFAVQEESHFFTATIKR